MWEFEFEAPRGYRIFRYGCGVTAKDASIWYSYKHNRWFPEGKIPKNSLISTHANARTFKAFKRHLRKHGEPLKGATVVWVNRYIGYNITAKWKKA